MAKRQDDPKSTTPGIRQKRQSQRYGRAFAEALIDTVREGLLVLTPALHVETANHSFYTMFKVSEAETVGKFIFELGNGQWDIPDLRRLLKDILPETKVMNGYEMTHTFEDIGERTMLLNARQLDAIQLILLAIEDISERKESEEKFTRSEIRFQQAFEVGPVAAVITTLDEDRFLEVNQSFVKLTGYEPEEVIGRTAKALSMWSSKEDREKRVAAIGSGEGYRNLEMELRTKDGNVKDILGSGEKIRIDGDYGWLKMFVDITDQKRTQEELMKAIHEVIADTAWFSRSVVERLATVRRGEKGAQTTVDLSPREKQVLGRVARGMDDKDIAKELGIVVQTVRNYVTNIYGKIDVHSRAEAVVWARERGIIG